MWLGNPIPEIYATIVPREVKVRHRHVGNGGLCRSAQDPVTHLGAIGDANRHHLSSLEGLEDLRSSRGLLWHAQHCSSLGPAVVAVDEDGEADPECDASRD